MPTITTKRDSGQEELVAAQAFYLKERPLDAKLLRSVVAGSKTRAVRPEKWYEEIGEIHFGINRGAKLAGYAKIQAHERNADGTPGAVVTSGIGAEMAAMLSSPYGGQRALIERYFTLMKVPGDAYLIRTRQNADGTGDHTGYDIVGSSELDLNALSGMDTRALGAVDTPIRRILMPASSSTTEDEAYSMIAPEDFLGRIWRPAIRFVQVADSPMRALDTQCEILHLLTLGLKGKLLSRLALNGILYVPSEINDIRSGQPDGAKTDEVMDNKTFSRLIQAASWAIQNYEDPRSALPIFASGPAAYADAIKHIILDREVYQTDMALRAEMIDRILTGLDVQKQRTKGTGSNHWEAWNHEDDEMRVNVKPDLDTFMWALNILVLNRTIVERNMTDKTAGKYMFWYDLSDAQSNMNLAEDARQGYDRILIGGAPARKATGFTEEAKPVGDELVQMVGAKMNNAYLALWGTPEFDKIDWDKVAAVGSTKAGPNEATPADTPETQPGNQPGKRGGRSESDTPARLKPAS